MSKLVIVFVCLAVFEIASALQCYKCDNCQGSSSSWEKSTCGSSSTTIPANNDWACVRINYKDRLTYKDAVQRKCVLAEKRNGQLHFGCPTSQGEPSSCPICQTDLCNSATGVRTVGFVAVASVATVLLLSKLF
ncbi:unnamed protein product [Phyllotreta striolata]|uniref:Protein sleepless n=1 Tax=Phyllotreta striolata TaxID=444603 RepID=A0A9N9XJG3_PHYSR|nr:unnamed protein product [Phyllotreta striolata]